MLRNIETYLKNSGMYLKNFKKYLKRLEKYQYGLDCLFNEHNEGEYIKKPLTSNNSINARSVLMSLEVIFLVKKQRDLEKNSIKRKLFIIF